MALEAVLAIVIILDDPGIPFLCEVNEVESLLQRHSDTKGVMAGGCEEDKP
jgi:hypothetical protein